MERAKLIFIDDDADDRELFNSTLHSKNLNEFLIFESAEKVIDYVDTLKDEQLPEIIITDLNMPGIDGVQLINYFKSIDRFQKIPIFILTTSARSPIVDKAIRHGAAGYYQKPQTMGELEALLQGFYQISS